MKEKKAIWNLFNRLKPIITAKLLNHEDKHVGSRGVQLVVPLNAGEADILVTRGSVSLSVSEASSLKPIDLR